MLRSATRPLLALSRPSLRATPLHKTPPLPHLLFSSRLAPIARQFSTTKPTLAPADPTSDDGITPFLTSNRDWATSVRESDPAFFQGLSKGQSPKIFWIGCCDSRVPETTILGRRPGEVFVYRNIANILNSTDLSLLSALEYAVVYLKVQHIIVCGHTSCGGVAAALDAKKLGKIDTWLIPLRELRLEHADKLAKLEGAEKGKALVELNVRHGVEVLRRNADVIDAKESRGLKIHGVVFDLPTGELKNLDLDEETKDSASLRKSAFALA